MKAWITLKDILATGPLHIDGVKIDGSIDLTFVKHGETIELYSQEISGLQVMSDRYSLPLEKGGSAYSSMFRMVEQEAEKRARTLLLGTPDYRWNYGEENL